MRGDFGGKNGVKMGGFWGEIQNKKSEYFWVSFKINYLMRKSDAPCAVAVLCRPTCRLNTRKNTYFFAVYLPKLPIANAPPLWYNRGKRDTLTRPTSATTAADLKGAVTHETDQPPHDPRRASRPAHPQSRPQGMEHPADPRTVFPRGIWLFCPVPVYP